MDAVHVTIGRRCFARGTSLPNEYLAWFKKCYFQGYTVYRQSRDNQGFPRFECYPDLNHASLSRLPPRERRQGNRIGFVMNPTDSYALVPKVQGRSKR
jgi:hypothetical protein